MRRQTPRSATAPQRGGRFDPLCSRANRPMSEGRAGPCPFPFPAQSPKLGVDRPPPIQWGERVVSMASNEQASRRKKFDARLSLFQRCNRSARCLAQELLTRHLLVGPLPRGANLTASSSGIAVSSATAEPMLPQARAAGEQSRAQCWARVGAGRWAMIPSFHSGSRCASGTTRDPLQCRALRAALHDCDSLGLLPSAAIV